MKDKKTFKSYLLIWIFAVVIVNVLILLFKQVEIGDRLTTVSTVFRNGEYGEKEVYKTEFLNLILSYIFVMLAFIAQLICTKIFLTQESLRKTLYHYPMFAISLQGLGITIIFALIFLFCDINPILSFVIFLLTFFVTFARCVGAKTAANMVSAKDENIELKTQYIKILRTEFDTLILNISDSDIKMKVKNVFENVKYADPVSTTELVDIEEELIGKFQKIKDACESKDINLVDNACNEFEKLMKERNLKLKNYKP